MKTKKFNSPVINSLGNVIHWEQDGTMVIIRFESGTTVSFDVKQLRDRAERRKERKIAAFLQKVRPFVDAEGKSIIDHSLKALSV